MCTANNKAVAYRAFEEVYQAALLADSESVDTDGQLCFEEVVIEDIVAEDDTVALRYAVRVRCMDNSESVKFMGTVFTRHNAEGRIVQYWDS